MRTKLFSLLSVFMIFSMVLAACAPSTVVVTQVVPGATQVVTQIVAGTPQVMVVTATPAPTQPAQAATFKSKDSTTLVNQEFGEPETLDPALDYETGGNEIIQNAYDFLVFYNKDKVSELVPMLATEVPTLANGDISADGKTYTFKIRQNVKFHNGDTLKPSDVAYTFQRGILQGGTASPQWLFVQPVLGSQYTDVVDVIDPKLEDDAASLQKADAAKVKAVCTTVTNAITADDTAGTVTFKLAQPWGPFLITLAGAWGAVTDKAWEVQNGAWDGSCDTWQKFYGVTSADLNKGKLGTAENGTGPYMVDHWTPTQELVLKANPNYWVQKPLWDGGPTGVPKVGTVIVKFVSEMSTRLAALQAGDADTIQFGSRADWVQFDQLVGETCDYQTGKCTPTNTPDKPIRRWTNLPTATRTDIFFTFNVDTSGGNNYIGSGKLDGNGVPPDFFNDVHIRKAFAYCFNYDAVKQSIFLGEGAQSTTLMLPGEPGSDPNAPHYTYDLAKCKTEFQASTWKAADGKSLWDTGFRLTVAYNTGNTARGTYAQILAQGITAVNNKFIIEATSMPWATFLRAQRAHKLPAFVVGWQEDIPDPHDWLIPYAGAGGTYSAPQNMPKALLDQFAPIIQAGALEADPAKRATIYKQFDQLWYDNVPDIMGIVAYTRFYEQRWDNGFIWNPLFGYLYYYTFTKN